MPRRCSSAPRTPTNFSARYSRDAGVDESVRPSGGLESVAATDRGHDQVERRVLRVAALLDEILRRLLAAANPDELRLLRRLMLAEVKTQSALAVVDLKH